MFKSQKPSSVDLRVSDFKRVPGFNYVLSVSAEDEHTYNSLCSDIREAWAIRVKRPANLRVSRGIECGKDIQVKNGGKAEANCVKGGGVLIEQSEAIAQPQEAG